MRMGLLPVGKTLVAPAPPEGFTRVIGLNDENIEPLVNNFIGSENESLKPSQVCSKWEPICILKNAYTIPELPMR